MLNLIQLQERLKKQPDNVVVAAANGQIKNIPPFMASSELLRRKQMRDEAAATQSAEMEGADTTVTEDLAQEVATPRQAKEQIAGLMALQGNRQQQAARQQAGIQSAMAMAAPNTTTSEPAQLAAGGAIDDIVVPRDFEGGGIAMNPDVMKKLMMLKAMKARQQGVAGLPMKQDMFRRGDYAGGGIVAFAGPEGSFVERSPGFYQLESELPKEESAPTTPKEVLEELLRRRRQRQSLEERMAQAGLLEPPGPTQELAALEAQQQRRREADTLARRVMSLDPLRIGRSMADYLGKEEAAETDIEAKKAKARDLHASAKFNAAKGNIKDAIADEREADKTDKEIATSMADVEHKGALAEQAFAGKTTDWKRRYDSYLPGVMQRLKKTDPNDPQVMAVTARMVDESIGLTREKVDVAAQQAGTAARREDTQDYEAAARIVDPMIGQGGSKRQAFRQATKAAYDDEYKKQIKAGKSDAEAKAEAIKKQDETGRTFRANLIQEEVANMRARQGGAQPRATPAPTTGTLPAGLPPGSKQIGTSGGKPVYQKPNGERVIAQ